MGHLYNRRVLLGISGGIAAYKGAQLVRELQERGAEVRVIMTRGATAFITPLTLQALSGHPVHIELLDEAAERGMGHIQLARWADLLLIAPATADLAARLALGRADDLLTTVALATAAPRMLAPAMNREMWQDPATRRNLAQLAELGYQIVEPGSGSQACGETGPGRLEEPERIADAAAALFDRARLAGLRVLITAGPTREPLDPVRYLSNHSSGKMGFALARAAVEAGARTRLIAGPVQLETPQHVSRTNVTTAQEMLEACLGFLPETDIFIGCAAVADYRPRQRAAHKIKKAQATVQLELERTPDILATVAGATPRPFTVGFAAETERLLEHARAKLERKKLDLIVANDVSDRSIGFDSESNAVTVLWKEGSTTLATATKLVIACQLLDTIAERREALLSAVS